LSAFDSLSLQAVRKLATRSFRTGQGSRPDVLLIEHDGERAVLKDHNACDPLFGFVLGPLLVRREAHALEKLRGIEGVPGLIQRIDRRALLMAHVSALPVKQCCESVNWPVYFSRLYKLVQKLHERGVAHCDLRSPNNMLVDKNDNPFVVDFVACVFRGAEWNPLSGWLFTQFCRVDESAIAKMKRRYAPELLDAEDTALLERNSLLDRLARGFGVTVRNLSRVLFTRRHS
jgi:hypothetical protein